MRAGRILLGAWLLSAPALAQEAPPAEARVMPAPGEADPPSRPEIREPERGVDLVLPIFRLAFGTSRSVEPSGLGGFAFDLVLGTRLMFQPLGEDDGPDNERWHPALTGELGYSRRAGDYGTHDLTLGLGVGLQKMVVGLHLVETITFPVDGSGRFGLRTALRADVFLGLLHFELGYEAGFVDGAVTHDIRGVLGVDVGLLISVFVMTSKIASWAN